MCSCRSLCSHDQYAHRIRHRIYFSSHFVKTRNVTMRPSVKPSPFSVTTPVFSGLLGLSSASPSHSQHSPRPLAFLLSKVLALPKQHSYQRRPTRCNYYSASAASNGCQRGFATPAAVSPPGLNMEGERKATIGARVQGESAAT